MEWIIPPEVWKKERTRIARKVRRGMHVVEVNPGPASALRFDYITTAAEITQIVEGIMRDTERLVMWSLKKAAK